MSRTTFLFVRAGTLGAIAAALVVGALMALGVPVAAAAVTADSQTWLADSAALPAMGFGGLILNRASLTAANTGFRTIFNNAFAAAAHRDHYLRIAMTVPSTTSQNTYPWLAETFDIREWMGERQLQNLATHDFTIKNKDYEGTVAVKRNAFEDDELGVYGPLFQQMGHAAAVYPNRLVFPMLTAGFTTRGWDGQYFFDTDHPGFNAAGQEVSVSNHMGGAGTPWFLMCSSQPTKPIIFQDRQKFRFVAMDRDDDEKVFSQKELRYGVDGRMNVGFGMPQLIVASKQPLDPDNYAAARAAFAAFRKRTGEPLGLVPDLLVSPMSLEANARKVLKNDAKANGESNEWRDTAELFLTPWL